MEGCIYECVILTLLLWIPICNTQDIVFHVQEEQENAFVGKISDQIDLDSSLSADALRSLRYTFLTQGYPFSSNFSIVNTTGQIYTRHSLDRDDICGFISNCLLELEVAIQSVNSQYFRKVRTHVYLDDVNDNAPVFPSRSISLRISEDVSVNSSYSIDGAIDRDIGVNSLQKYELQSGGGPFTLHVGDRLDGGKVVTLLVGRSLDREAADSYQLVVTATDGGIPAKSGRMLVNVTVIDVNDNSPVFVPSRYNVSVNETTPIGTMVVRVFAFDADSSENGVDHFRFSPIQAGSFRRYLDINKTTGEIFVISSLEKVQGETFSFVVECVDKGSPPLITQGAVLIEIADSINSAPSINLNLLSSGRVSEYAQPGTVVAHIAVLDPDSGRNGIVRCFISSDVFELQGLDVKEYKVIVVKALDREVQSQIDVSVTCEDAGLTPLNTTIYFTVEVRDENDHAPYFLKDMYTASLDENTKGVITQVSARDFDLGVNGEIEYIIPNAWQVGVDVLPNGDIVSDKRFDRETTPKLAVTVFARDKGVPPRNSSTTVVITINDVNDVTPMFSKQLFLFKIRENKPPKTRIDRVLAFDLDAGVNKELTYYMEDITGDGNLALDLSTDGVLRTNMALDREAHQQYEFRVWVADRGQPSLSSSAVVVVDVTDQNDNPPIIQSPAPVNTSISVPHGTAPGTIIMVVIAHDVDVGVNAQFQFHLASGQERIAPRAPNSDGGRRQTGETFGIDSISGELILKRSLTADDTGLYRVTVVVTDQGVPRLSSNVTMDILVFTSNATGSGQMSSENTLVVVILGSLTGIITVAVIVTIVVIKRSDRTRTKYRESDASSRVESSQKPEITVSSKNIDSLVIRNDVSFDSMGSTQTSQDSQGRLLGRQMPNGSSSTDNDSQKRTSSSTYPGDSVYPGDSSYPGETTDWPTALKLHQDLLKFHGLSAGQILPHRQNDDTNSDISGETTTSDSGRGGSDEDSHSHGRASPESKRDLLKSGHTGIHNDRYHDPKWNDTFNYVNMTNGRQCVSNFGVTFGKTDSARYYSTSVTSFTKPVQKRVTFQSDLGSNKYSTGLDDVNQSFDDDDTTTSGSYTVETDNLANDVMLPIMNDILV
ncbi:protocadherin-11 X-linked-like [Gigantopelta aegis]|uniref:protocadherin-11 X-linked-like n=1 Tax=Gigantopelta aegis TaxID=1735272 RepID=UPI001B887EBC|nr:protocadherin-11 X-linked-like [Gigantopelta aegis]XP_041360251.1 protocadherin-11 X-linked-like [Gigantopelta aegis]